MAMYSATSDPLLLSVMDAAALAREQSLAMLDLIDEFHASSDVEATDAQLQLSKQQKLLNTHLAQLRALNRTAVLGVRSTKQQTAEARQEIDSLHLQLQNLYYEQRHLRGEIAACQDYAHTYEQISMLGVHDFLALHPEHRASTEHDLTLARIQDEHAQRLAFEEQKLALMAQKEALLKETTAKKDELARLDADMEKWVNGQAAVRKLFDVREKRLAESASE